MKTFLPSSVDRQICGTVWTSRHGKALLDTLAYDFGPRPPGSKALRQAQNFIAEVLRDLGAHKVYSEPVSLHAWREAPSQVELVAPRRRLYESLHCVHSAAGNVTAPLLNGGNASEEPLDQLGRRVEGSILLIGGHVISGAKFTPLAQQIKNVQDRGAVGVLLRSMYPAAGCPAIGLAGINRDALIPVLAVSHEAAHELEFYIRQGHARVHIRAGGESYRTRCTNLIADFEPAKKTDEMIVLSAHLDTFYVNPGALDNLTGVVTLLETVRALGKLRSKFKRVLRLIIYTGEEYGFCGSKAYVQSHSSQLDSIRFVFNMDTLFPATAEGVAVIWSPSMRDYIDEAFRRTQCVVDVRNLFCMSSDYLPFVLQGIAAARPADWRNSMPPWSHTRVDTPDKVVPEWIRLNAMTYAQLLAQMLLEPRPLPTNRKSREQIRDLLAKEGVVEALQYFGFDV